MKPRLGRFIVIALCVLVLSIPAILIAGCIAIPIPAKEETVVFGRAITAEEAQAINVVGEGRLEARNRFGAPTLDFGPQRIYVYVWVVNKGAVFVGGYGFANRRPWLTTHLLVVAFDLDGRVLKIATSELGQWDTVSEHVRGWLSSEGLATQVPGPRPTESAKGERKLFVYRPSSSECSAQFALDGYFFKPSVAVDGNVVGDLAKGDYLSAIVSSGVHEIALDPMPGFRAAAAVAAIRQLASDRTPMVLNIDAEHIGDIYIQASVCMKGPGIHIDATVRESAVALQALGRLRPAW
jgi:hypothetical protein